MVPGLYFTVRQKTDGEQKMALLVFQNQIQILYDLANSVVAWSHKVHMNMIYFKLLLTEGNAM